MSLVQCLHAQATPDFVAFTNVRFAARSQSGINAVNGKRFYRTFQNGQVNLVAAKNESSQNTTNSSSSGFIGASISAQGVSATASASKGQGKSDGQ